MIHRVSTGWRLTLFPGALATGSNRVDGTAIDDEPLGYVSPVESSAPQTGVLEAAIVAAIIEATPYVLGLVFLGGVLSTTRANGGDSPPSFADFPPPAPVADGIAETLQNALKNKRLVQIAVGTAITLSFDFRQEGRLQIFDQSGTLLLSLMIMQASAEENGLGARIGKTYPKGKTPLPEAKPAAKPAPTGASPGPTFSPEVAAAIEEFGKILGYIKQLADLSKEFGNGGAPDPNDESEPARRYRDLKKLLANAWEKFDHLMRRSKDSNALITALTETLNKAATGEKNR